MYRCNVISLVLILLAYSDAAFPCERMRISMINTMRESCAAVGCWSYYLGPDFMHNNDNIIHGCDMSACGEDGERGGSYWNIPSCPSTQISEEINSLKYQSFVCGSIVNIEGQQLGEKLPIVGTNIGLRYFTHWTVSYKANYKITIPVVKASFPIEITEVQVSVSSDDGLYDSQSFLPSGTDIDYSFTWNGLDLLGNLVNSSKEFRIEVNQVTANYTIPSRSTVRLGSFNSKSIGIGGWVPTNYLYYDIGSKNLYKSDGSVRIVQAQILSSGHWLVPEEDGSLVYIFNDKGNIHSIKTGLLGSLLYSFSYDMDGNLLSINNSFGQMVSFIRNSAKNIVSILAPKGQSSLISLDANKYLSSLTNPNSETFTMTYAGNGQLISFKKPGLQTSLFSYDADGYLVRDEHSGGYFLNLVRINSGKVDVTTNMGRSDSYTFSKSKTSLSSRHDTSDGLVNRKSYSYTPYNKNDSTSERGIVTNKSFFRDNRFLDGAYYLSSESYQNSSSSYSIDVTRTLTLADANDPFSILNLSYRMQKGSSILDSVFDPLLRQWSHTTGLGKTSFVGLDMHERVQSLQNGNMNPIEFVYVGENLSQINYGTRQILFTYDPSTGFLVSTTNSLSENIAYSYDSAGRVISQTLPDFRVINYSYDPNGKLLSITPPGKGAHSFAFNGSEMLSTYEAPLLSSNLSDLTSYSYNDDKQVTSILRPNGDSINFNYSAVTGAMEGYSTPDGLYIQSSSSNNGLPTEIKTPQGIITSIVYKGSHYATTINYNISRARLFAYEPMVVSANTLQSDVVMDQYSGVSTVEYSYDGDEYLQNAGDIELFYSNPNGHLSGSSIGSTSNKITDSYVYNLYGEVTGYSVNYGVTPIYELNLTRDDLGRVINKNQLMNSVAKNYDYDFDSSGRLVEVQLNSALVSNYAYDSNSNRTGGVVYGTSTTGVYDDQDRLNSYNVYDYTYNANGELQAKVNTLLSTVTSYIYDVFGNLKEVTLPSADIIAYEVDGLNRRIGKKLNGVLQKRWVYMDQLRIAGELDASGNISKRFVYASKQNIPDYMIYGGENYRIISDHLGSLRFVIKVSDGTIIQRMDHDEFGRVIEDTNPGFLPFGFAGGLYDYQTGLVRFGARDYDPEIGRWTSKDPILFNGQMTNLYGYSFHDPVNFVDLDGKIPALAAIPIAALVGGVASSVTTAITTKSLDGFGKNFATGAIGGATAAVGIGAGIVGTVAAIPIGLGASLFYNLDMFEPNANDFFNGLTQFSKKSSQACSSGGD